ncbi:MAG: SgcJ/EcaC family oxidoreductase [Xanthomonadales bacterium]|nr:SgcJ/EcaC family oxidoreductase [Xanthomonadales bacterium]
MIRVLALLLALLYVSAPVLAQTEKDREDVLRIFDSWNQGWANRDVELAVQDYADDADWTNAFGDRFQGKPALTEGLRLIFGLDFVMAGDSAQNEYQDVRFLGPDTAVVRSKLVRSGQQRSTGELMADRHINHLRVLEKRAGRWLIVSHLISQAHEKR